LHVFSQASNRAHRRFIHFVFGAVVLPPPLQWL
jgi:hypothetical protein